MECPRGWLGGSGDTVLSVVSSPDPGMGELEGGQIPGETQTLPAECRLRHSILLSSPLLSTLVAGQDKQEGMS